MTTRRSTVLLLAAVVLSVGFQQSAPRAQLRPWPDWAADRRPIAAIQLFNGTWGTDEHDVYGLLECWRVGSSLPEDQCGGKGGVPWLMDEMRRRYKYGYRRFMLHLPAGREIHQRGKPLPSAQWHVLDDAYIDTVSGSVRQDFQDLLTPWLAAHGDVQVLIYQGLRFDDDFAYPWLERGDMDEEHATVPDLTIQRHLEVVRQNTGGWLSLTPRSLFGRLPARPQIGFAFDNTGTESTRDVLVGLVETEVVFGRGVRVFVSGEAIPHESLPAPACQPARLLPEYLDRAPWLGLMAFHVRLDPQRIMLPPWTAPQGSHLGFAVHNREHPLVIESDGSCHEDLDTDVSDDIIREAICSAYKRNFIIIHYGGRHDRFIHDLYKSTIC